MHIYACIQGKLLRRFYIFAYYYIGVPHFLCRFLFVNHQFTDRTMISGSEVFPRRPSPFGQTIQSIDGDMIQPSAYDPYDIVENQRTEGLSGGGWTVSSSSSSPPAKMKIMRKATSEYPEGGAARKPRRRAQAHQDESQLLTMQQQAMGVVVRVCSDCNTTKTPLWRSGPRGPKVNYQVIGKRPDLRVRLRF
jgi:hypothetical protein